MEEVMLTIKEAAERLRLSEAHVRKKVRERKINGKKVGKNWLIPLKEVDKFMGIETDMKSIEKDFYISQLESTVKSYEEKFSTCEDIISTLKDLMCDKE